MFDIQTMQAGKLCMDCKYTYVTPDLALMLANCEKRPQRTKYWLSSRYKTTIGALRASEAGGCPWCTRVIRSVDQEKLPSDESSVIIDKTYHGTRTPERVRLTYLQIDVDDSSELPGRNTHDHFPLHAEIRSEQDVHRMALRTPTAGDVSVLPTTYAHVARDLLRECVDTHAACSNEEEGHFLPSRLLEITDRGCINVRLRETAPSDSFRYAALSYCWGGTENFVTRTVNYDSHTKGILTRDLPNTVAHAIEVANALDIHYIWVDALCIIQDSKQDKLKELKQMRRIYKDSYITIIASGAATVFDGFPQSPQDHESKFFRVLDGDVDHGLSGHFFAFTKEYVPTWEPVNQRAWTLEERMLSRRTLIFAQYGIIWQCQHHEVLLKDGLRPNPGLREGRSHLSVEARNRRGNKGNPSQSDADIQLWHSIVRDYSDRLVTRPVDKLVAIAGVAEELSRLHSRQLGKYLAGLWSNYLQRGLVWSSRAAKPKPSRYRAPSWSWASIDSGVGFQPPSFWELDQQKLYAEVLEVDVEEADGLNGFGSAKSAHIVLRAPSFPARWTPSVSKAEWAQGCLASLEPDGDVEKAFADVSIDYENALPADSSINVIALMLCSFRMPGVYEHTCGIILMPTGEGAHQRVAYFGTMDECYVPNNAADTVLRIE